MATTPSVRRWRSTREIIEALEPHEPASTLVVAPVVAPGLGRGVKVWRVDGEDGQLLAALCITRTSLDRWEGALFEVEPGAAPALRPLVRRLPVRRLYGPSRLVHELLDDSPRASALEEVVWFDHPVPVTDMHDPDPRVRVATALDLPAVVDLYAGARQDLPPTVRRLRRYLARLVEAGNVMILEEDGVVVGGVRIDWRSRRYGYMSANFIREDRRGEGMTWPLVFAVLRILRGWGIGMVAMKGESNPTRVRGALLETTRALYEARPDVAQGIGSWSEAPDAAPEDDHAWVIARLTRRSRVPGVAHLWRALELVEGPVRRG